MALIVLKYFSQIKWFCFSFLIFLNIKSEHKSDNKLKQQPKKSNVIFPKWKTFLEITFRIKVSTNKYS